MRNKMLDLFWYWINERHSIYLKKEAGDPWPWTKDPILQEYKFTNVFRELDAVTKELALVKKNCARDLHNLFFNIALFRMFNWPATYYALDAAGLTVSWNTTQARNLLQARAKRKEQVFTGAYIITNNGLKDSKISLVCKAVQYLYHDRTKITADIAKMRSIEEAVTYLSQYPMIGKFVGYEIATDLRHTKILNNADDVMTWANPGPGAMRGLNRIHGRPLHFRQPVKHWVVEMRELLSASPSFLSKHVPALEMRDVEHSLCEFDKYMRVKLGEGRPRSKYRPSGKVRHG